MMIDQAETEKVVQQIASGMGRLLNQSYRKNGENWWLYSGAHPSRILTPAEVSWHVERNHFPFVENGIKSDHPDWWKEPAEKK
jgi:hypothetical protein